MDMTGACDPWGGHHQQDHPVNPDFSRLSSRVAEREAYRELNDQEHEPTTYGEGV